MNNPKIPNSDRNWESIDIFLFSNGQQSSPPRKYHLNSEELQFWDATLIFLARSQFGSMHSSIELYTLDGKKIEAPLDLTSDTAYVAIKPPDAFIQTGYEKYLLKASRSREKRQQRLNSTEMAKTANIEINIEQFKSNLTIPNSLNIKNGKKQDGISLDTEIEYLAAVTSNTINQSQKDTESLKQIQNADDSIKTEKTELLQRKKPGSSAKNTILKKIYPNSKTKDDGPNLSKKRNTSFPKNLIKSNNNSKRLTISSNNTTILKTNLEDIVESKEKTQADTTKTSENAESKEKAEQCKNDPLFKRACSSDKDLTVLSDVYKNTESDIQSVFLDADRKTALLNNDPRKVSRELGNVEEYEGIPRNCLKTNKTMSRQSAVDLSELHEPENINKPGTFILNLNIDLKGCTVLNTHEKNQAGNCKSYITVLKPEKASQVNVDVNFSDDTLNVGDDLLLQEQSVDSGIVNKTCEENVAESNTKVIIIRCRCSHFNSVKSTPSSPKYKEKDNFIFLLPTQINNKITQRSDVETRRTSDKEIQESLHSCIRVPVISNSEIVSNKKPDNVARHKVSISREAPKEFNSDTKQLKSQGDMQTINTNNNFMINKINNFAQTDWCNVLLQAKCQQDGRYTFHLPPLHLLTYYNLL